MTPDEAREHYEAGWRAGARVSRCICDLERQPTITRSFPDETIALVWHDGEARQCVPVDVGLLREMVNNHNDALIVYRKTCDAVTELTAERDELRARIDKALALHAPDAPWPDCRWCQELWPCPTVQALMGGSDD